MKVIKVTGLGIKGINFKRSITCFIAALEFSLCIICLSGSNCYAESGIDSVDKKSNSGVTKEHPSIPMSIYDLKKHDFIHKQSTEIPQQNNSDLENNFIHVEQEKKDVKDFIKNGIYPVVWGNKSRPELSLTFDDGYSRESIERVLNVLSESNIKSTFFVIGNSLEQFPDLWKQAVADGHEVCNHTRSHCFLSGLSQEKIVKEIKGWEDAASSVLGEDYIKEMKGNFPFFRLPGGSGSKDERILKIIEAEGYIPVGWSSETCYSVLRHYNLKKTGTKIVSKKVCEHIIATSQNGSIVLLHFNRYDTSKLDEMIEGIRKKGIEIKSVSNVLREE